MQCTVVSELTLAEKLERHHGRNRTVSEPATQTSQEQERELPNKLEAARPVHNRLRSKLLHYTYAAPESSPSTPHREDSKSGSEACSAAVAQRHCFPERRGELKPETAMQATGRAGTSIARSPAVTYNNTSKIAPGEASVPIESLKERKQRTAPHRESAAIDKHKKHSACNPGARENDLKAGGQHSRHLSAPSSVAPLGRAHASVGGVSSAAAFYASVVGRQSAKCAQQAAARAENSSKLLSTGTSVCLPTSSAQAVQVARLGAESSSKLTHRRHSTAPVARAEKKDRKGQQRRHSMNLGVVSVPRSGGAAFYSNVVQIARQASAHDLEAATLAESHSKLILTETNVLTKSSSLLPTASSSQTAYTETKAVSIWGSCATSCTSFKLPAASVAIISYVIASVLGIIASLLSILSLSFQKVMHKCWRLVCPSYTQVKKILISLLK